MNDNAPEFQHVVYRAHIKESASQGAEVLKVSSHYCLCIALISSKYTGKRNIDSFLLTVSLSLFC